MVVRKQRGAQRQSERAVRGRGPVCRGVRVRDDVQTDRAAEPDERAGALHREGWQDRDGAVFLQRTRRLTKAGGSLTARVEGSLADRQNVSLGVLEPRRLGTARARDAVL